MKQAAVPVENRLIRKEERGRKREREIPCREGGRERYHVEREGERDTMYIEIRSLSSGTIQ